MRVGILTFHNARNYGACLQAYALLKALKKLGSDAEIINYRNKKIDQDYALMDTRSLRRILKSVALFPVNLAQENQFNQFRRNNLQILNLRKSIDISELKNIANSYDRIICGSDQVWNLILTKNDLSYYLDFLTESEKKAAYAPSFGVEKLSDQQRAKVSKLLNDFKFLSVREIQGQRLVSEMTGREAEVVLDPTMLLTPEDWKDLITQKNEKEKYILVYCFESTALLDFAQELGKKKDLPILQVNGSYRNIFNPNIKFSNLGGPKEWVDLFYNATYIVTNSFHGTAFSINLKKNFFFELLPSTYKVNSRLENIVDIFGLRDRQIVNGKNQNIDIDIDFSLINPTLERERDKSVAYLQKIISNHYE